MIENSKQIKNRTTRPQILKQVQDDVKVGFGRALAFTLAEVLIVIGIIGVVAALTLPNLNHATGDKETVTRLQKAYSILNEANDRAVAIYGPLSTWKSNEQCANNFGDCWMERIGNFLKISKYCDARTEWSESCNSLSNGLEGFNDIIYQLSDDISFAAVGSEANCDLESNSYADFYYANDLCLDNVYVDINGPLKGKNQYGKDLYTFNLSDSLGLIPYIDATSFDDAVSYCMNSKNGNSCTWWVLEYGNLDYLKADENGKCNDSNIILDGTTNTSCH